MSRILLVGFAVVLAVSYFKGVRQKQTWGTVLVVVCVLGIVGVIVERMLLGGRYSLAVAGEKMASGASGTAQLLGKGLKGLVPAGGRIVVMGEFSPQVRPSWPTLWSNWQKGLSDGLGDSTWQLAGYYGPANGTAESVSGGLAAIEGGFDAVVSFYGLPDDLENLSIYQLGERPKVAAFFPSANLDRVRDWLSKGLIEAAVIEQGDAGLRLCTKTSPP